MIVWDDQELYSHCVSFVTRLREYIGNLIRGFVEPKPYVRRQLKKRVAQQEFIPPVEIVRYSSHSQSKALPSTFQGDSDARPYEGLSQSAGEITATLVSQPSPVAQLAPIEVQRHIEAPESFPEVPEDQNERPITSGMDLIKYSDGRQGAFVASQRSIDNGIRNVHSSLVGPEQIGDIDDYEYVLDGQRNCFVNVVTGNRSYVGEKLYEYIRVRKGF